MEFKKTENTSRKDSNKVYFLILVIVALLGTNAYLFFKDKKSNDRVVVLTDEKSQMSVEIDKIEAELQKVANEKLALTDKLKEQQLLASQKIQELRNKLRAGELTEADLVKAQAEVKSLRTFVTNYTNEINDLKNNNASLMAERDSLKTTIKDANANSSRLERQNSELSGKVKMASALKTSTLNITAIRHRSNGRETTVTRASTANKLHITFSVAPNSLAKKTLHDVFVRVIDATGNLVISDNGTLFTANGDDLQYTYRTGINFDDTPDKLYTIEWTNPNPFQKGDYTILLYSGGYTMGQGSITLR